MNVFTTGVETCTEMNGSFEVVPSGGTAPYTFSIDSINFQTSPDFTGLSVGSYQVYVRDSLGCTSPGFTTFIVGVDSIPVVDTVVVERPSCNMLTGNVTVAAIAGRPPFQYAINGGSFQTDPVFDNLAPGTYV